MLDLPDLSALGLPAESNRDGAAGDEAFGRHLVTVPALFWAAGTLRRTIDGFLAGHERRADVRQVVDEFATTALIELRCTCCRHGQITLTVDRDEQRIRVELSYRMALSHAPVWKTDEYVEPIETFRRGLALINAFCDRWGHIVEQVGEPFYTGKNQTWFAVFDNVPRRRSVFTGGV